MPYIDTLVPFFKSSWPPWMEPDTCSHLKLCVCPYVFSMIPVSHRNNGNLYLRQRPELASAWAPFYSSSPSLSVCNGLHCNWCWELNTPSGSVYRIHHVLAREHTTPRASKDTQRSYSCVGISDLTVLLRIYSAWRNVLELSVR